MPTPSIALASLSIEGFRGIESLELDFHGPDGNPNQLVVLAVRMGAAKPPCSKRHFSQPIGPMVPNWSQARLAEGRFVTDLSFTGSEPKSRSTAKKAKSSF